ncbi:MAG: hypothetical protein ACRC7O_16560, partial [Fimbriiglobus sp.]
PTNPARCNTDRTPPKKLSIQAANDYLAAVSQFSNWLVEVGRVERNPYTGYRVREMKALTPACFRFDAAPPAVELDGKFTKNGKSAFQPIPAALAAELRTFLAGRLAGVAGSAVAACRRSHRGRRTGRRRGARLPFPAENLRYDSERAGHQLERPSNYDAALRQSVDNKHLHRGRSTADRRGRRPAPRAVAVRLGNQFGLAGRRIGTAEFESV